MGGNKGKIGRKGKGNWGNGDEAREKWEREIGWK